MGIQLLFLSYFKNLMLLKGVNLHHFLQTETPKGLYRGGRIYIYNSTDVKEVGQTASNKVRTTIR